MNTTQVIFAKMAVVRHQPYQVSVSDGMSLPSLPATAIVTFTPLNLFISNNYLTINPGQAVALTASNLNTTDPGDTSANLHYIMNSVERGQFTLILNPTLPINQFTQQQINDGDIQFISDNSEIAPSYTAEVQDSCGLISNPSIVNINFHFAAQLGNNNWPLIKLKLLCYVE